MCNLFQTCFKEIVFTPPSTFFIIFFLYLLPVLQSAMSDEKLHFYKDIFID